MVSMISLKLSIPASRFSMISLANTSGSLTPSAFPITVLSGLNAFTVSITWYHCPSLPLLPTHQVPLIGGITRVPARLDSRPVANGYLNRFLTYKTTRPCQAATNG